MAYNQKQIEATFKVNLDRIPSSIRGEVLNEIGNYIITSILDDVGGGLSPVTGKRFKSLDQEYADEEKGGDKLPNLELEGDMLGALNYRIDGNEIIYGITDEDQAAKAYGHNTGMKGHKFLENKVPVRKFIPNPDEQLRLEIRNGINNLLDGYRMPEVEETEEEIQASSVIERRSVLDLILGGL